MSNDKLMQIPQGGDLPHPYMERRVNMRDLIHEFWRENKVSIVAVSAAIIWTLTSCGITGLIVRKNTTTEVTAQVTSQLRADFQRYLDEQEEERRASQFLTGDASLQAAIDEMVPIIAEHIAGLRMDRGVTIDGAKTYIWGVDFTRLDSGKYGSSIQEVVEGNVEGYVKGHAVRNEDREIARELVTAYMHGERPDRWRPDLEFAEINPDGSVTARNMLFTNSMTKYWGYEP